VTAAATLRRVARYRVVDHVGPRPSSVRGAPRPFRRTVCDGCAGRTIAEGDEPPQRARSAVTAHVGPGVPRRSRVGAPERNAGADLSTRAGGVSAYGACCPPGRRASAGH
jgi:hypothetical protein